MKVILVGNGRDLMGKAIGSLIDEFDIVVRCNNFVTAGFETDLGTRFDWLARRSCSDITLHDYSSVDRVYNFITFCPLSIAMRAVAREIKKVYRDKYYECGVLEAKAIGEAVGLNQPKERCSVGVLAVGYLHDKFDLTITNFDKVAKKYAEEQGQDYKDANPDTHYFAKPPVDSKYHNWDKETDYIYSLIESQKIGILI